MTSQDLIRDTRVAHVRELKAEIARLTAARDAAETARAEWESHFAWTLVAARDADRLPPEGRMIIVDGWNVTYNVPGALHGDKQALIARAKELARDRPADFIWIVFDGATAHAETEDNWRVSYTGGTGDHRADRLIVDYLRALNLAGRSVSVTVVTGDADFARAARRQGAEVTAPRDFFAPER